MSDQSLKIRIQNCNNIEDAQIEVRKNALNIKYGPNGLGKSTIAKAIYASTQNDNSLKTLMPFKYKNLANQHEPQVSGAEDIKTVMVFDDAYVSQFVFLSNEVVKNSFEIFIRTDSFNATMTEIEAIFSGLKKTFEGNQDLLMAIADLKLLRDTFNLTKTGAIAKTSKALKAFGTGYKIENIPESLAAYSDFIKSDQPSIWISWQAKGNSFLGLSENCPYCSSDMVANNKKEVVTLVAQEYDSKAVEHLSVFQGIVSKLGKYFESSCREKLNDITRTTIELSPEASTFLTGLIADIDTLVLKLESLRSLSFYSLRDVPRIEHEIEKFKIDLSLLSKVNSPDTKLVVDPVNEKLSELAIQVHALQAKVNAHKDGISKTIVSNQTGINNFLVAAGYRYKVRIDQEPDSYKMKIIHDDLDEHLGAASQHLSYGEKNAFALVLFMYQALRDRPDLIILDDPVSSFDKTKKFAILNEMFRDDSIVQNTSILMLTHDIEPAVDVLVAVKHVFSNLKAKVSFLASRNGIVKETRINRNDLQTFAQICRKNISISNDYIIKCIYARRHFELLNDRGAAYDLLANLLHGRAVPTTKVGEDINLMTEAQLSDALKSVRELISDFDYVTILKLITNKLELLQRYKNANFNYEKLQLFRIYSDVHGFEEGQVNSVLRKFTNESVHVENEYVMQLNPHKYDSVPDHIIEECERLIGLCLANDC